HGFGVGIEDDLASIPEVESLSPLRVAPAEVDGEAAEVMAVDTATIDGLYDMEVASGDITDVHGSGLAVESATADDLGTATGDTVSVRFADGEVVDLTVRAVFDGGLAGAGGGSWLVGLDTFEAHVADQYDRQVYVSVVDGIGAAESRAAIEAAVAGWPNAEI